MKLDKTSQLLGRDKDFCADFAVGAKADFLAETGILVRHPLSPFCSRSVTASAEPDSVARRFWGQSPRMPENKPEVQTFMPYTGQAKISEN